ncbi:hypothetical protein PWT90_10610 [Aphanocladium album]|nr:hypothetical protein PWT90_10610 [Aphanocladium album]
MNRFRTKKRTKDDVSAPRPSMDSETAGPFKLFGGKKKLPDSDSKQDLNLDAALPPSDDFRTSLLMTGLSARFSMLREQDDPHSKIGKASDDSVLFPKRQSRLMDFGYDSRLQDIAEIESLQASSLTRINSSHGSEDTDAGNLNIMDRARPNDGNNLFGGRQKIYRIGAGAKTGSNGMGGRILYDEDVAKSAFQKWRQSERERTSFEDREDVLESDSAFDYNKKRATNSTTSSGASAGRNSNSTAATSVASQAPSTKDGQSTIPSSASNVERSFTRTRRLYEQGLTQDLQDQQSSALSRMDTLSKTHRNKTTADGMPIPSPTSSTFGDRVMERRTLLTKGSAPNLRSFTPPTSAASQQTPIEPVPKFTSEQKSNFGVSPPLSPPISEADDHPMLSIQPNDRGKATAMGVFNRPAHQYDDSKFAQRQQQMRKGRDSSDTQSQTGARSPADASRSRSSSMHRGRMDATPNRTDRTGKKDYQSSSFFDDSDDASGSNAYTNLDSSLVAQLSVSRPNDEDHPAFRKSALPTPLSLSSRASDDNFSVEDKVDLSFRLKEEPPEDSPTLGPAAGAGLSGMVRQHLRGDSNASSIYDTAGQTPDVDPRQQSGSPDSKRQVNHGRNTSWGLQDDEFGTDSGTWTPTNQTKPTPRGEQDEFARHLADGARRVREKLTSYAEPDNEQSLPPVPPSESTKDLAGARNNALGILRTKSSRTSLFDRGRDRDSDSKSKSGKSPAPSARKTSGETTQEEPPVPLPKDDNVHAGLKAFRQARRELQKMKELEVQQRHGGSPQKPSPPVDRPAAQRAFSHDPSSVSPPSYQHPAFPGRRQAASERDRSGSESSRDGYDRQRRMPPRGVSSSSDTRTMMSHSGSQSPTMNKKRDISEPAYLSDSRLHPSNLPGATVSTPNLHAPAGAPPLPPINPRRKNGIGGPTRRSGEQTSGLDGDYDESGDERRQIYRATSDQNGDRSRHYPPAPTHRPPLPHANASSNSLPGGMI